MRGVHYYFFDILNNIQYTTDRWRRRDGKDGGGRDVGRETSSARSRDATEVKSRTREERRREIMRRLNDYEGDDRRRRARGRFETDDAVAERRRRGGGVGADASGF